jgi:hypothetical protein
MPIVEAPVFVDGALQPTQAKDDQMIQALLAKTPDPMLGKGIGVGRCVRSVNGINTRASQDRIKIIGITSVVVTEEEPCPNALLLTGPENVAGLLVQPWAIGREGCPRHQ